MSKKDKWISIKEFSEMYDFPEITLRKWCKDGVIPSEIRKIYINKKERSVLMINIGLIIASAEIQSFFEEETRNCEENNTLKFGTHVTSNPGFGGKGLKYARMVAKKKRVR